MPSLSLIAAQNIIPGSRLPNRMWLHDSINPIIY